MATGALGLSYLKYKEDTYATIFKIFIWVEIVFNVIAILYLSFILFFTGLLGAATVCLPEDLQCQSADDALFIINLVLGITDLICLGVVILMCLTLSHFNKVEHDRKSHHYEMQKQ
jgi:amino acid transporter